MTLTCTCRIGWAGSGKVCGLDSDLDGYPDVELDCTKVSPIAIVAGGNQEKCRADNCPNVPNSGQEDADNDGKGDACDEDRDDDGVKNQVDNCVNDKNTDQANQDNDKYGDVCDLCPTVAADEHDTDGDKKADACDEDIDDDGVLNELDCIPPLCNGNDNCPYHSNTDQRDFDGDGWGDACDNCPEISNEEQADQDENGIGDVCDGGPDGDKDGIQDSLDNCPNVPNYCQLDADEDGRGDVCDNDSDNDGVVDEQDNCPLIPNPGQEDKNSKFESFSSFGINYVYQTSFAR